MKTKTIIICAVAGLFTLLLTIGIVLNISYGNEAKTLKAKITAKQSNQANVFDAMWKIISQKAQLTEDYKNSFSKVLTDMVESRYSKGDGSLMKWVQEQNPTLDASVYRDLGNTIESQRMGFVSEQKELLDMSAQFNILISRFPGSFFLSDEVPIYPKLILSSKTEQAQKTGKDDDVKLFN